MSFLDHVLPANDLPPADQQVPSPPPTAVPGSKWVLDQPAASRRPEPVVGPSWWWSRTRKAAWREAQEARARYDQDQRDVSTRWPGNQLVMVQNIRGKNGKTTVTVLLSSAFGHYSGSTPVAVDLNPTGNLAIRVECGTIHQDIDQMACDAPRLLNPSTALSEITAYTVYQPSSRFAALLARPRPYVTLDDGTQEFSDPTITIDQTTMVLTALGKVHPITIGDGSNNTADMPSRAVWNLAHALVVPMTWHTDDALAAMETLKGLDDTGRDRLANTAIIAHMNVRPDDDIEDARHDAYTRSLTARGLTVVDIPYDPAIAAGEAIVWDDLQSATRQASLHLAAEVARRFTGWPR